MSLVGSGDIAAVLPDRDDLLFFASGVSNSQCVDELEYQRELDLLLDQPRASHIVYFSSLGVLDGTSRYYRHKRDMEVTIKINFIRYTIVRIGNIITGDNPHTIVNFLKNKIINNQPLEVQDVYRHLVTKEEFLYWISKIPPWSCEMNIPGRMMKVQEIVDEIKAGKL